MVIVLGGSYGRHDPLVYGRTYLDCLHIGDECLNSVSVSRRCILACRLCCIHLGADTSDLAFQRCFFILEIEFATLFTLAIGIVILAVLLPPSIAGEQSLLSVAVSLAYPILDVVLLTMAIPLLVFFMRGVFWRPMLVVVFGIILTLLGDILFSLTVLEGTYYDGHPLELFFYWSYLAFALGFYLQATRKLEM